MMNSPWGDIGRTIALGVGSGVAKFLVSVCNKVRWHRRIFGMCVMGNPKLARQGLGHVCPLSTSYVPALPCAHQSLLLLASLSVV